MCEMNHIVYKENNIVIDALKNAIIKDFVDSKM